MFITHNECSGMPFCTPFWTIFYHFLDLKQLLGINKMPPEKRPEITGEAKENLQNSPKNTPNLLRLLQCELSGKEGVQ